MMRPLPAGLGVYRPPMRTASSANQRKNSAPYLTSPMLSASTLPISRVISGGDVVGAIGDRLEDRAQDLAAFTRGRGGPLGLHGGRGVERGDGVFGGGVGDGGQHLVVGRVEHVECRRALAFLATDPEPGGY